MTYDRNAQYFSISYKGVHLCFIYARTATIAKDKAVRTYQHHRTLPEQVATGDTKPANLALLVATPAGVGCTVEPDDSGTDDFHTCA